MADAQQTSTDAQASEGWLERYFELRKNGTTIRTEVVAGVTTFLAMAYIIFVNPNNYLQFAGMDVGAVFVATCLAAATGTLIMGLWAKYPIAQAPGMGLNAFFAFTVVGSMGISWEVALAGTFMSGLLFFLLAVTGVREAIINAIPLPLKLAVGAGIGLFITFIGLTQAGIVQASEATYVTLGDLTQSSVVLAIVGIIATTFFLMRGLRAAVFYGIVTTAVVGLVAGLIDLPTGVASLPPSLAPTLGQAFVNLPDVFTSQMIIVVFTMLFVDLFDTSGTLIAVANQAGMLDEDGKLPRANRALTSDAIATMVGAGLGTSTTTSYIESSAGVGAGGRTGLTSVVTSGLFVLALFFSPLLAVVTPQVTAAALIVVGLMMAKGLGQIDWSETEYALPAFVMFVTMPLTYNIAHGLALGLFLYPLAMIFKGRVKDVHVMNYVLAVAFVVYFVWLR